MLFNAADVILEPARNYLKKLLLNLGIEGCLLWSSRTQELTAPRKRSSPAQLLGGM